MGCAFSGLGESDRRFRGSHSALDCRTVRQRRLTSPLRLASLPLDEIDWGLIVAGLMRGPEPEGPPKTMRQTAAEFWLAGLPVEIV